MTVPYDLIKMIHKLFSFWDLFYGYYYYCDKSYLFVYFLDKG